MLKLPPCQRSFIDTFKQIYNNEFKSEYGCDCVDADVHIRFNERLEDVDLTYQVLKACEKHCKYLKYKPSYSPLNFDDKGLILNRFNNHRSGAECDVDI